MWLSRGHRFIGGTEHATTLFFLTLSHSYSFSLSNAIRNFLHRCTPTGWETNQRKIEKISNYMELGGELDVTFIEWMLRTKADALQFLWLKKCSAKINVINFLIIYSWDFFFRFVWHSWLKRPAKMPFCIIVIIHIENDKWCCVFVSLIFVDSATIWCFYLSFSQMDENRAFTQTQHNGHK